MADPTREQFDAASKKVMQSAPAGLSREQFYALIDRELTAGSFHAPEGGVMGQAKASMGVTSDAPDGPLLPNSPRLPSMLDRIKLALTPSMPDLKVMLQNVAEPKTAGDMAALVLPEIKYAPGAINEFVGRSKSALKGAAADAGPGIMSKASIPFRAVGRFSEEGGGIAQATRRARAYGVEQYGPALKSAYGETSIPRAAQSERIPYMDTGRPATEVPIERYGSPSRPSTPDGGVPHEVLPTSSATEIDRYGPAQRTSAPDRGIDQGVLPTSSMAEVDPHGPAQRTSAPDGGVPPGRLPTSTIEDVERYGAAQRTSPPDRGVPSERLPTSVMDEVDRYGPNKGLPALSEAEVQARLHEVFGGGEGHDAGAGTSPLQESPSPTGAPRQLTGSRYLADEDFHTGDTGEHSRGRSMHDYAGEMNRLYKLKMDDPLAALLMAIGGGAMASHQEQ